MEPSDIDEVTSKQTNPISEIRIGILKLYIPTSHKIWAGVCVCALIEVATCT